MSKIPMKINLPEIGEVEVLLTDDQAMKAIADGKELFKASQETTTDTANYIYTGGMATDNSPGGFTGNTTDWDSFFPDVSLDEIKKLADDAVEQEEAIRTAAMATCSLITIALSAYMAKSSQKKGSEVQDQPDTTIGQEPHTEG